MPWLRINYDMATSEGLLVTLGQSEVPPTPALVAKVWVSPSFEILAHVIYGGRSTKMPWTGNVAADKARWDLAVQTCTDDLLSTAVQLAKQHPLSKPLEIHEVNFRTPIL